MGFAFVVGLLLGESSALAQTLPLRTSFEIAEAPLTTEKIWELDPTEPNPHRQFWVLDRRIQYQGLQAIPAGAKTFGVVFDHIASLERLYLRAEGTHYEAPLSAFPCGKKQPDGRFSMRSGALVAGRVAAQGWQNLLRSGGPRLALRLSRLREPTPEAAVAAARAELAAWLLEREVHYDSTVLKAARQEEWKAYWAMPAVQQHCEAQAKGGATKAGSVDRPWTAILDPTPKTAGEPALLARAPARRWAGRYTVRLTMRIGKTEMMGQFLVDTSASHNLVSPYWLRSQGIEPRGLRILGEHPERVQHALGSGVGQPIQVDAVQLAGQKLSLRRFLLSDTEDLLDVPEFASPCCDGILNADFLREYVVEFVPGPPSAIQLYDRKGFVLGRGWAWEELGLDARGYPRSEDCRLGVGSRFYSQSFWNTGWGSSEATIPALAAPQFARELRCEGGLTLKELSLQRSLKNDPRVTGDQFALGVELAERGNWVLDLPHGRVWFSPALQEHPGARNRSGLEISLNSKKSDRQKRIFEVRRLEAGSIADRQLAGAGLKVGLRVLAIDGLPVEILDDWEIQRHLRGAYGKTVMLKWRDSQGQEREAALVLAEVSGVHSTGSTVESPIADTQGSLMNPRPTPTKTR